MKQGWFISFQKRSCRRVVVVVINLLALAAYVTPVWAVDGTWTGLGNDGTWSTVGNWSGGVPGASNTATFDNAGNGFTTIAGNVTLANIIFNTGTCAAYTFNNAITFNTAANNGITINNDVTTAQIFTGLLTFGGDATVNTFQVFNNGSGLLTLNGSLTSGGTGKTLNIGGSGNITVNGLISQAASTGLVKSGSGTLTLSGANTFAGSLTISEGTVVAAIGGALGNAGKVVSVANGSTLTLAAANVTYTGLNTGGTLTGGGIVNVGTLGAGSNSVILNGNFSGFTGTLNIGVGAASGAGKVQMNGADNTAATINVLANGTVYVSAAGIHNASLVLNGGGTGENLGQLRLDSGTWAGTITLAGSTTGANGLIGSTSTGTITGTITETGGSRTLSMSGGGVVILTNNNTYSGGTSLIAGTLGVFNTANLGTAASTITFNGGTLRIYGGTLTNFSTIGHPVFFTPGVAPSLSVNDGTATFTVDQVLNQTTGGFSKWGAGTAILDQANTYSGQTTINQGILSVASLNKVVGGTLTSNLGAPSSAANGTIRMGNGGNAATLLYTGAGETTDRVINMYGTTGGATIDQSGSGLLKFTSALSATNAVNKTLTLQGSTAGTGEFVGAIMDPTARTTGTFASGSGTMSVSGTSSFAMGAVVSGTGIANGTTITAIGAGTITLSANTTGSLTGGTVNYAGMTALTKSGTSTWVLSGNNTYRGATTISGGALSVGVTANLGGAASTLTFNGGTLQITGTTLTAMTTIGHPVVYTATKTVGLDIADAANTFTADQVLSQTTGGLIKSGSGTLVLSQANTYTGDTRVAAGVLVISNNLGIQNSALDTSGAGPINLTVTTPTFGGLKGSADLATVVTTGYGSLTSLTLNPTTGSSTYSGAIANSAAGMALIKSGTGTQVLAGANTYAGGTTISAGTLSVSSDGNLGGSSGTLTLAGGALQFGGSFTVGATRTTKLTASSAMDTQGNTGTIGAAVSGSGYALTKTGSGTLVLNGGTLTTLTVSGGIVDLGSTDFRIGTSGSSPGINGTGGTITASGGGRILLGVNGADWSGSASGITINAVIANGAGSAIDFYTSGTIILKGANKYTGGSTLIGTVVQIGVDSVGAVGSITSSAIGTGTLTLGTSSNGAAAGLFSDSTAPRTILNPVAFGNNATLGNSVNNGTLTFSANVDLGTLGRTLTVNSDVQFDGIISNTGSITKAGIGTLTLAGANNYGGSTSISGGVLVLGNVGAAGPAGRSIAVSTSAGGGSLRLATDSTVNKYIIGTSSSNAGTLVSDVATPGNAAITHVLGLAALGNSTLTFTTGPNATGTGTISLDLVGLTGGAAGTSVLNPTTANVVVVNGASISSNGTFAKNLQLDGTSTGNSIGGVIQDGLNTLSLIKANTSIWTLTGTSTYSGATAVNGGSLLVNGRLNGTGTVTVTGGLLGGTGVVAGLIVVDAGTLSPGNSVGTLTASSSVTLNGGAVFLVELSNTQSDLLQMSGGTTLTLNGPTLTLAPGSVGTAGSFTVISGYSTKVGAFSNSTVTDNNGTQYDIVVSDTAVTLTVIPEPFAAGLLLLGLGGLLLGRRRNGK